MTQWILVLVFAGGMSGFGSTQKHEGLTEDQCRALLTWLKPGMGRTATGVCVGPEGQVFDANPLD